MNNQTEPIGIIRNLFPLIGEYEYNDELQEVFDDEYLIDNALIIQMCQKLSRGELQHQIIEYLDTGSPFSALEDLRYAGLQGYVSVFEKPTSGWNSRIVKAFYFKEIQEVFEAFEKWCEE